jgi:uncharacterized protein YwqG
MSHLMKRLEQAVRPGIWLRKSDGGPLSGGVSSPLHGKLGGLPELPAGVAWPRHLVTKMPLHFLAQINLGKLPAVPIFPTLSMQPALAEKWPSPLFW